MGRYEGDKIMSYAERLYGLCPSCEEYALPAGKIVCCQECLSIIDTETNKIMGSFAGGVEAYYKTKKTLVPVVKEIVDNDGL